jgi:hypothetical protein
MMKTTGTSNGMPVGQGEKQRKLRGVPPHTARWVVEEIIRINEKIRNFWSDYHYGWAPPKTSEILSRSRLDRQVSFSTCLSIWFEPLHALPKKLEQFPCKKPNTENVDWNQQEGLLILAWANLGSLVEGTMKFGLTVFANNYATTPITRGKNKKPLDPDELDLERLKQFFNEHFWTNVQRQRWFRFVELVQQRRNAIHSYQDRDIGDLREFYVAVKNYLVFLSLIEGRVPYPDELPTGDRFVGE